MKIRLKHDLVSLPAGLVVEIVDGLAEVWIAGGLAESVPEETPVGAEIIASVQQQMLIGLELS